MTTEQKAEQYAEERYPDDKNKVKQIRQFTSALRTACRKAYLDGAKDKWVKYDPETSKPDEGVIVLRYSWTTGKYSVGKLHYHNWAELMITHFKLLTPPQD